MDHTQKRYHRSTQREAILAQVRESHTHPTAEEIFARLKLDYPRLSLGTVYRNLHILADQGEIAEIHCGSGSDRFDGNTANHYHFLCRRCGELIDLSMPVQDRLDAEAAKLGQFRIERHTVEFHGLCSACQRAESELRG